MVQKMLKSPVLRSIQIILATVFWLAACTPSTPAVLPTQLEKTATPQPTAVPLTPTPTLVQGTVRIWHSLMESQVPALEQAITDFQNSYPGIQFDVLYLPVENLRQRYEQAVLEGYGPDILLGPADWAPALFEAGLVADLSGLANQELLNTFNRAALDSARYKDVLTSLPYAIRGVVLYRNKLLIPQAPATFDQLVSQAKSVTQGETIGAFLDRSFYFSGGHLPGIGGEWMAPDGMPAFNNEKGIAWLELLKSFELAGPTDYLTDNDLEAFKEGRVGFIIDGTWNLDELSAAVGSDAMAIDPWPSYKDGYLSGFVQSDHVYLTTPPAGRDSVPAWKFIESLLSPEAQTYLPAVGLIPAVTGVKVADPVKNMLISQVITALAGGSAYPAAPQIEAYMGPVDIAMRSFFDGGLSAAEALKAASDSIFNSLSGANATPTP
jgi:arabinogalactan oligomer/maltooligosaccharide transport system substrate-binding protein